MFRKAIDDFGLSLRSILTANLVKTLQGSLYIVYFTCIC